MGAGGDGLLQRAQWRESARNTCPQHDAGDGNQQQLREDDADQDLVGEHVALDERLRDLDGERRAAMICAADLGDAHRTATRLAVVRERCGVGSSRRQLGIAGDQHAARGSHGVVDVVVLVEEQRALRVLLEVERRHCADDLDVQVELARDLHQFAVVDAVRQVTGEEVAANRIDDEQQRQRDQQPAQQLAAQRRATPVIELVEQVAHAAHRADVDAERSRVSCARGARRLRSRCCRRRRRSRTGGR